MPFYGDLQGELDSIDQRQQAREMARRQASTVTAAQVQRANSIQRDYKWLPAGASMAFAKSGIDDATIERVASQTLAAKSKNTALGLNEPGDLVNAATEAKRAKAEWVAKLEGTNPISRAVKPVAGKVGGALGAVGGAAVGAVATGDNPFANVLRGTTRNVTAAFDLPMQAVQGQYRNTAGQIEREGWASLIKGEKWDPEGFKERPSFIPQTDLGVTLGNLFGGKGVDQGSGFFVGDKSGVANARREAQIAYGYWETPDGRKIIHSIGRDFAGQFYEPGSAGFNRLSGVGDFAVAVGADLPVGWLTATTKAAKGFKAVGEGIEHGDEVTRTAKMRDALGMIFNPGSRQTHSPEVLENWLSMKQGIKTADEFAVAGPSEIWAKSKGKMRAELVQKFADAQTPDEVREVFRANLGQGIDAVPTRAMSKYGVSLKESYMPPSMKRMVNRLPSAAWWDADDPDEVLTQFDRQLDGMIMPPEQKKEFFDRMAMIPHVKGDRATWNLRKKVYTDALDSTIDRIVVQQSDLTGLEGIDVMKVDLAQGTYLDDLAPATAEDAAEAAARHERMAKVYGPDDSTWPESARKVAVTPTALTADQRQKIREIRANQKRVREVFNPLKEGRYKDDVIFDMDNLSMWQGTFAGGRTYDPEQVGMAWKNALDEDTLDAVNKYSMMGYLHDERYTAENVGRTLDSPERLAGLHKSLEEAGVPEQVTLYRGSEPGTTATGKYINATMDPTQAGFYAGPEGELVKMTVPRSSIVGFGNTAEHEVLIRADEAGKAEKVAFDALGAEEAGYRMGPGTFNYGQGNDPWLMSEFHGRMMPTPDWDAVHKELSTIGPMLNAKGDLAGTQWAHQLQEQFWKPLVVLRPAAALRIIGETQAGLWASNMASIYTHPLSLISMALADTRIGERFKRGTARATGVLGDEIEDADAIKKAMNVSNIYTNHHTARYLADGMVKISKGEKNYHDAVFYEINMFRKEKNDPLPRMIADSLLRNEPLSTVEEQLWNMPDYRRQIQDGAPARVAGDDVEVLMERAGSDAYARRLAQRMTEMTGNDPVLLQDIADPKLSRDELLAHLKGMDQDALRNEVHGPRKLSQKQEKSRSAAVNWLFSNLIRKPVHAMSEAPAVRQSYWKEVKALAPLMNPEDAAEMIANAEKAGLKPNEIRQLTYFANKPVADAKNALSLQQVDELGNYAATKQLQRLFEDHVDKRRFIDALGLISPFAHVWAESLSRWSRFMVEDPALLHQLDYAFTAAKNPDVAEAVGGSVMGVPEGRGFLYPDENGQERFAYPMSAQMMKQFTGVDVPLTGSLQGLSMGFDIVPGVGPIASIPISAAIPKTPEWDSVREIVFPFGEPKSLLDLEKQMPAWMQRVGALAGMGDQRTMASTTMDIMKVKMSSGDFDIHNPDPVIADAESKRLLAESRKASTLVTVMRGLAGAVSPSAPAPEWYLDDKTGKRIMLNTLQQDFHDMYAEDPQHAVLTFMETYGENVMLAFQGKTISTALGGGLPPTKKADQWSRGQGKGLAEDIPLAYGFFAPRAEGDELDFANYDRQMAAGERATLTPAQMLQESNKRVAQAMYYSARNELPAHLSVKQAALMRKLRDDLSNRFEGYESRFGEDIVGVPQQASVGKTIEQLTKATGDYRLENNPATKPLLDYLTARAQVRASSGLHLNNPDSWATSKTGAKARASLYNLGTKLAQTNNAFSPMWESVLYREFQSDFEADQGVKG